TIDNGADLIQRLENYQEKDYLQSTTYFITLHIKDPYTSITHAQLLHTLKCFLDDFIREETIQGMNTMAILKLTEFLLQHQYFVFDNRIYQQVCGGDTGLYFMELLIDIYLFYWQQPLLRLDHQDQHEIFVRCFNDIFLTWNESKEKFHELLKTMNNNDSSIQYEVNVQTKEIHYLDVEIHRHHHSTLQTRVYHDWKYQPYVLPTLHGISSIRPSNTLRMALVRAVLCCSQLNDFQEEQQYIKYSFLFHQFSFSFIHQHIEDFFLDFNAFDLSSYHDQATYDELRRQVRQWNQQTRDEKRNRLDEAQKQCIWYIHSKLKGFAVHNAKQNPTQFLPRSFHDDVNSLDGIKIEIVGIPNYPLNTK
ncbi:unnamed protein product, partial [Rotaria sp. Silwood2]